MRCQLCQRLESELFDVLSLKDNVFFSETIDVFPDRCSFMMVCKIAEEKEEEDDDDDDSDDDDEEEEGEEKDDENDDDHDDR